MPNGEYERTFLNSFYKASTPLIPKLDKDIIKENYMPISLMNIYLYFT